MCRSNEHGGRRCPAYSDPTLIANRNARRREAYAAQKANSQYEVIPRATTVPGLGLTDSQTVFLQRSKIKDTDGNPIKVYHGSAYQFDSFDPSTLGRGNDAWGNGFYFSHSESISQGYANETGSADANVKEYYLNIENPIQMDGKANMSMSEYEFTAKEAEQILLSHPDLYSQPDNEDNPNPLQDYAPEFWDKEEHSEEEMRSMARRVAKEYFSDTGWVEMESFYGRENGSAFVHAVHKTTGHDGVVVDFGDEGKHYIAWFPEQMKLTSNQNPDGNSTVF